MVNEFWSRVNNIILEKTNQYLKEHPEKKALHSELAKINEEQLADWDSMVYCGGSFYQGYDKLGLYGVKPAEQRLSNYEAHRYLDKNSSVLDIGSNAGFLSCEIASKVKNVTAVEYNPYLVRIGKVVADYLNIDNLEFLNLDFEKLSSSQKYDCVLSLSNHHTIDGNLDMSFENYMRKIFLMTNPGAYLLFESHNIWGDDNDLEAKFDICSKYFVLKRAKMVEAFYKPEDIDKLFAVFERRETELENEKCEEFNLELASKSYNFIEYECS